MPSSTATAQFGRIVWSSVRESVDAFVWRLPSQQNPLSGRGLGQFARRSPIWAWGQPLSRPRLLSSSVKVSPKNVRRSCTSGGLLLLGLSSPSPSTQTVEASCAAAATDAAICSSATSRSNVVQLARQAWRRSIHTGARGRDGLSGRRNTSSKASGSGGKTTTSQQKTDGHKLEGQRLAPDLKSDIPEPHPESIKSSMSKYIQSHLPLLPALPHRPSKEELLAAANGFWERLKVRFKWFSIRSMRPWNADEWGAFVSWFMLGHILWILVGTTTFFSLVIFMVNTVFAQGNDSSDPVLAVSCLANITVQTNLANGSGTT